MAKILADRDIKKLLGTVLKDADERHINPNGIELRLGKQVRFHSTGEEKELGAAQFLKVNPGETVLISSLEKIDFTGDTVQAIYPNSMLMGLITPTTTMMREGISQVATKIDAGFRGILSWGLRNGSAKEFVIQYGEPIFKLTIFLLDADESPDIPYGAREPDVYQDAAGIVLSARRIPADIPKKSLVSSSFTKLDPKKQLREAGYPFDYIGTELVTLQGKFEIVSKDVLLLKEAFESRSRELSEKIEKETRTLSEKLSEFRQALLERVEAIFTQKFLWVVGVIVACISAMYGAVRLLEATNIADSAIAIIAFVAGAAVLLVIYCVTRRAK
jgi:deoxycytidine triphosphate deaminase